VELVLQPPRTRSFSQLNQYAECGEQFRLERRVKVPRRAAVWFPAGTAFHSTCDDIDLGIHGDAPLDEAERITRWHSNFSAQLDELREQDPDLKNWRTAGRKTKEKPNGEDVEWWAREGEKFVHAYAAWRESSAGKLRLWELPDGSPAIEVEIVVRIGGAPVRMFVDRVFEDTGSGALLVFDRKGNTEG